MEIKIPVSIGEIFDKLSILEIKKKYIKDENKLIHIKLEIEKITLEIQHLIEKNQKLFQYILIVNEKIWNLIDISKSNLSELDFNILSRQIAHENDARFRIKSLIDKNNSSAICEVKSYEKEKIYLLGFEKLDSKVRQTYETLLNFYFDNVEYTTDSNIQGNVYNILNPGKYSYIANSKLIKTINNLETINYLNGGALGDLIHCLYVVKVIYLTIGKRGNIYLRQDFFHNRNVIDVYNDIKNIIEYQEYINKVDLYSSQNININLDIFRNSSLLYQVDWLTNLSRTFNIPLLTTSWLKSPKDIKNYKIVINRSLVRHVSHFPWDKIVNNNKCSFITFNVNDYQNFPFKDKVECLIVKNFDEMVDIISNCDFFIGNQSAPLAIAYALGKPCLGELKDPDTILYKNLNKYNEFIWISDNDKNLNPEIVNKYIDIQI